MTDPNSKTAADRDPFTGSPEDMAVIADLALLARDDPAPTPSAALMARVLADAADVPSTAMAPVRAAPAGRRAARWSLLSWVGAWQPVSAGLAAAALGVWVGWADPADMLTYAGELVASDTANWALEDTAIDTVDLLDVEI